MKPHAATLAFALLALSAAHADFRFRHHFIDRDLPGSSYGETALADLDRDGDLDFITGRQGDTRPIYWYEHQASDRWVRHVLGTEQPSDVGGTAADVDGDGWIDAITGGVWYRNPGTPRQDRFERIVFDGALRAVHDLVTADLDGDGAFDVLTMSDRNDLRWYAIPSDPREPWRSRTIGPGVHAGIAAADIDGDGDADVVRSNVWFENLGKGESWKTHETIPFGNPAQPYPLATRSRAADLDGDGDTDLVMTENEIRGGRIGWLENLDGKGDAWKLHALPARDDAVRGAYHSLAMADFDRDGDLDVFTCEMEHIAGEKPPRWTIWEHTKDEAGRPRFTERVILDAGLGGHEAVVGDVDGDGDLDIASKLWRPRKDNANGGRNHADYLENLTVSKSGSGSRSDSRSGSTGRGAPSTRR